MGANICPESNKNDKPERISAIICHYCGREFEPERRVAEIVSVETSGGKLAGPVEET